MASDRLEQIRRRVNRASGATWFVDQEDAGSYEGRKLYRHRVSDREGGAANATFRDGAEAELFAHARADLDWLLDELLSAKREAEKHRDDREELLDSVRELAGVLMCDRLDDPGAVVDAVRKAGDLAKKYAEALSERTRLMGLLIALVLTIGGDAFIPAEVRAQSARKWSLQLAPDPATGGVWVRLTEQKPQPAQRAPVMFRPPGSGSGTTSGAW